MLPRHISILTLGLLLLATCSLSAAPPNVLLITSEDHGAHLSCYGDNNIRTPHLDQLADDGMRFENAYVTYSVCSPSRASILTGLYSHQHGQLGLATHRYAMFQAWPNIPSLLKKSGYRTGIIGKLHVNPESAFPFDFSAFSGSNFDDRPMAQFADRADGFINQSDEPFFLMVNFPDAHFPLHTQQHGLPEKPLVGSDVKEMLAQVGVDSPALRQFAADYYNCLLRLDAGIGMLLDRLDKSGKADNTLVIYLSDHGAQFSRGKTTSYEGGMKVPVMLRWPGRVPRQTVKNELVSSVDILPTILDAARIHPPNMLPGRSLLALSRPTTPAWRQYVFTGKEGSTAHWTFPQRTARDERYKLIMNLDVSRDNPTAQAYATRWNRTFYGATPEEIGTAPEFVQQAYRTWQRPPTYELYDLQNDPHEFRNLSADPRHAETQQRLIAALQTWQRETSDPFADPAKLGMYLDEMEAVRNKYGGADATYRRDKTFRWRYLDYLAPPEVRDKASLWMPQVFGDHMVLQQGKPLPIWGRAPPGDVVHVEFGNAAATATATSDADGNWRVDLPPQVGSHDPRMLDIRTTTEMIRFTDVLVGEVWVCAGQSNMEWPLAQTSQAAVDVAAANRPQIRLLNLVGTARGGSGQYTSEQLSRLTPGGFCRGHWSPCTPATAAPFSAVGYFFGEHLHKQLDVPIGLINPSIGGTPTESWIRPQALASHPQLQRLAHGNWLDNAELEPWCQTRARANFGRATTDGEIVPGDALGPHHSFKPGFMWQAGIAPLVPFAIQGAIWYQGESNALSAFQVRQHELLFPLLVTDWREQWQQGDLPFLYVQLPALNRPDWPAFRDQQRRFLEQLPNMGMAVTIDLGHPTNVHPTNKRPVGERLARLALATTYQRSIASYQGPLFLDSKFHDHTAIVEFRFDAGLTTNDNRPPVGFEVAGVDRQFVAAAARIVAERVLVNSADIDTPCYVRYGWQPYPEPPLNLVNQAGLPASPFTSEP